MTVLVDLDAIRPGRLADGLTDADVREQVRHFRDLVRGAIVRPLDDGVRLELRLDARAIARLADLVRDAADTLPFWRFRLLAEPPECWLEVTGTGRAGEIARAVFAEIGR